MTRPAIKTSPPDTILRAKEIAARLSAMKGKPASAPADVPNWYPNTTETDPLIPDRGSPQDRGFDFRTMVTGSGNGPELPK